MKLASWITDARNLPTIAYSLGLLILGLLASGIWYSTSLLIQEQNRIGVEVNVAGRQRMLSQRIAMVSQDMLRFETVLNAQSRDVIKGCADLLLRAHVALLNGKVDRLQSSIEEGLSCRSGAPDPLVARDMDESIDRAFYGGVPSLDELVREYVRLADGISSGSELSEKKIEDLVQLAYLTLPQKLNKLVYELQKKGEVSIASLSRFSMFMWIATLIVIALEVIIIFRPMARKINTTMEQLNTALARVTRREAALADANEQILESINYARKIQEGILPDLKEARQSVGDIAVLWEPLQVVSGDFVWTSRRNGKLFLFIADCTGHGVPGALITVVVAAALEQLLEEEQSDDPETILLALDDSVRKRLKQDMPADPNDPTATDDGFEAALMIFDENDATICYAGAGIPLLVKTDEGVERISADRHRLAYRSLRKPDAFKVTTRAVQPGESYYLTTDGTTDHVGGAPKRTFGRKRFANVLATTSNIDLTGQLEDLDRQLHAFRGSEPPRDDYTVLAVTPLTDTSRAQNAA
ncbi:serine phosphatase RsbU (regulator of sigma subunit) [Roseibium hamelinense]|uniref:Serine phosphatase RsbU (Regulator of sigma subunit) n=1 Tax=Roseibium hamelinense TaxID=150831 RepID=A0A562TGA6_9HYPH|nr:SpoIIE family protein phosphatase [Roseibium hamelinense]MTI42404.1 hypothetical protein [Roseibium hamelinense]TWI92609.1 serine phosphatase RsbU (regulator of sigma subunit) [Roseibium hamelinense]